jgi:photosystem II stability/assembly factor-like uncharacterized protein
MNLNIEVRERRFGCRAICTVALTALLVLWASPARSHDPSAWGGLFRSRDHGATWVPANRGHFVGGALTLAISPTNVNDMLLGTDGGLLRSRNGGRDWALEAPAVLVGAVFAVAFAADGQRALASTGLGVFRSEMGTAWRPAAVPRSATPARAIVRGAEDSRAYIAGWTGLLRSDDWGLSWSNAAAGLPDGPTTSLIVGTGLPETLYVVVGGRIWTSIDGGRTWASRGGEMSNVTVDTLAVDSTTRLWAAGADRLFRSDDGGISWQGVGRPLPEPNTAVRGITVADEAIVITTDRGLYRSVNGGERWALVIENLPAHLEAGPLVRDLVDPATLYAGFALIPYPELWRRVAEGHGALTQVSLTSLAGAVAILAIVALGAHAALRRLGHYYHTAAKGVPPLRNSQGRCRKTALR